MLSPLRLLASLGLMASAVVIVSAAEPNTLTASEKSAGWQLLFDGHSTDLWRSHKSENFPALGWEVKDGLLSVTAGDGAESARDGDIITRRRYANFELVIDFRIAPGANSGIKYFVQPSLGSMKGGPNATVGSGIGYEYQILDDARHPDAKKGRDGNRTMGSLYDLLPADPAKQPSPIGEWNTARIVVRGSISGALAQRQTRARLRSRGGGVQGDRGAKQVQGRSRFQHVDRRPHSTAGARPPRRLPEYQDP